MGYDPFKKLAKTTKGNEPSCVAFFSTDAPVSNGQKIRQQRLKLRKSRKQFALDLGISQKTLWGWETDRWQPSDLFRKNFHIQLGKIKKQLKTGTRNDDEAA
jgi:DNA-binding transcriptional regulator YiaG